jgi:uncharacterized membrane protein
MSSNLNRPVEKYLKHLDAELADLPHGRRREIVDEIADHIAEARADLPAPETEADIRTLLERLGDPADIAAEARQRFGVPVARSSWMEPAALVFLLVGGFFWGIGWLIGLVLLWLSAVWTTRDKVIGTLVVPGGLALPAFLLFLWLASSGGGQFCSSGTIRSPKTGQITTHEVCTGGGMSATEVLGLVLVILLLAAEIFTAVYLGRRIRRRGALATV